jgi:hypothetical protein
MTVSAQTQAQVGAVLDRMVLALSGGDRDALGEVADPAISGFWCGRPVHSPDDLADAAFAPFALEGIEISCEGAVAWVDARLVAGKATGGFTSVLRGTGHAWLVAQVHASLPV